VQGLIAFSINAHAKTVWYISGTKVVLGYPEKAGIFGSHVYFCMQFKMATMLKEATVLNQA